MMFICLLILGNDVGFLYLFQVGQQVFRDGGSVDSCRVLLDPQGVGLFMDTLGNVVLVQGLVWLGERGCIQVVPCRGLNGFNMF